MLFLYNTFGPTCNFVNSKTILTETNTDYTVNYRYMKIK